MGEGVGVRSGSHVRMGKERVKLWESGKANEGGVGCRWSSRVDVWVR